MKKKHEHNFIFKEKKIIHIDWCVSPPHIFPTRSRVDSYYYCSKCLKEVVKSE